MGQQLDDELQMYKRMERGSKYHPGRNAVRSLLDSFDVDGPEDEHRCLVHPPLWESILTFLHRNPVRRLPPPVLAFVLQRLFLALDYLHTECQIIHAGLYPDFAFHCFCHLLTLEFYQISRPITSCSASPTIRSSVILKRRSFKALVRGRSWMEEQSTCPGSSGCPGNGARQSYVTLVRPCPVTKSTRKISNLISIERPR